MRIKIMSVILLFLLGITSISYAASCGAGSCGAGIKEKSPVSETAEETAEQE